MSCGVGYRRGSDPTLLWLWHRLVATALIRPLAWELPELIYDPEIPFLGIYLKEMKTLT